MRLAFILEVAKPWRGALVLCSSLLLVESLASLAVPWLAGRFADLLLARRESVGTLLPLALMGLFALQAAMRFVSAYLSSANAAQVLADLRARLHDHVQSLPLAWHQGHRKGEVLSVLTHDVSHLSGFITGTLVSVPPLILALAGALVAMARIDARLTAAVILALPLYYLLVKALTRKVRPLANRWREAYSRAISMAEENLGMIPAIKAFAREQVESRRYRDILQQELDLAARQRLADTTLGPLTQFLTAAGVLSMAWFLGLAETRRTPGEMLSFLLYAGLIARPFSGFANLYGQVQYARGALSRLQAVLDEPAEGGPDEDRRPALPAARGHLAFEGVDFAYPGRPAVLSGLHLRVEAGQCLALTGPNGCGKSTLVHLLLRLMEPDAGRICIDGVDIATVSLRSLRRQIGMVPQHVLLFNATVRENIAYGWPEADLPAIEAAARAAQAHEFIQSLPQQYDTRIGDQGVRLSGGQRQRLALARALLKDPPILIFDEATAMFDPQAERAFIDAFRLRDRRATLILVTHRPASLALADRVVDLSELLRR